MGNMQFTPEAAGQIVQSLYFSLLRRSADESGLQTYQADLVTGHSSVYQVVEHIMNSAEFKRLNANASGACTGCCTGSCCPCCKMPVPEPLETDSLLTVEPPLRKVSGWSENTVEIKSRTAEDLQLTVSKDARWTAKIGSFPAIGVARNSSTYTVDHNNSYNWFNWNLTGGRDGGLLVICATSADGTVELCQKLAYRYLPAKS